MSDRTKSAQRPYDYRISQDNFFSPPIYGATRLYQAGRLHCHAHTVIDTHTQLDYIELTVCVEGKGVIVTNGEHVAVSAGDIHVSFPGDFHAIHSDTADPLKFDFLTVRTEDAALQAHIDDIIAAHHAASARIIRSEQIRRLVARAINELNDPDDLSDRVLSGLLEQILICVIREFRKKRPRDTALDLRDKKLLCLRLMNYIDNHLYSIKSLRELTEVANYSYNYLSNTFQEETGMTLQDYLRERRFDAAVLLLREGRFSVGRIAELLGYSSVYSFSLAFKRRFGYAPTQEKRQNSI